MNYKPIMSVRLAKEKIKFRPPMRLVLNAVRNKLIHRICAVVKRGEKYNFFFLFPFVKYIEIGRWIFGAARAVRNGRTSPPFYGSGPPAESGVRGTPQRLRSTDSRAAGAVLPGIRFKATLWGLPRRRVRRSGTVEAVG